jgi:hypothetical protein
MRLRLYGYVYMVLFKGLSLYSFDHRVVYIGLCI